MTFEEYLQQELNKPDTEWFDPDGDSARAVVKRMKESKWEAYKWEWRPFWEDTKYFFTDDFEGFDTPVSWFVALPVNLIGTVMFPISMAVRCIMRYKIALSDYKDSYKITHKN